MTQLFRAALIAGAIAMAGLAGCQKPASTEAAKPAVDAAAVEKAVRDNETQWNADYKAKDLAKLVAHYAPDATLMDPEDPPMTGTEAITAGLKAFIADPALDMRFAADKVGVSDDGAMAYTRGSFKLTATDPKTRRPMTQTGSYVTVYRKQADGSWKAVEDIATSQPAPAAAPAKAG